MDCNKAEALRVVELAEKRFKDDLEGALKLALKAQKLFPSLDNLRQTIAAYEVHLAAATMKLTSGQTDWHAVLRVDPSADHNTIKKQFRNMCLLTHPDKNRRSTAADGAFRIVMKAWSMLSSSSSSGGSNNTSSSSRSSSSSSTKPQEKPQEPKSNNCRYLYAKVRCRRCGLLRHWDFSRVPEDGDKSLYHYCKSCSNWCVIKSRPARAEVPLACQGCDANLSWGSYRPLGYECSGCGSSYVVGVDPDWIPKSQPGGAETWFRPETLSCPYCGAWNRYDEVDDAAGNIASVGCRVCGLRSLIKLASDSVCV